MKFLYVRSDICHRLPSQLTVNTSVFSNNKILQNPISVAAAIDLFRGLHEIPVRHISSGRVYLLSQIDAQWGGIVIDKKYNADIKNILK